MIDNATINQLLARAGVVANETEDSANDANRIGTLFADIIRALSMSLTEEELSELIAKYGDKLFLSKVKPDAAAGRITMSDGIQLGESYVSGLAGRGGLLDGSGRGEMRSLRLWEWLEVPELRYNRTEVVVGDEWQSPGGGIIESVDNDSHTIRLKLEQGEIGMIDVDDLCMAFWHDEDNPSLNSSDSYDDGRNNRRMAGFATCYFLLTAVNGSNNGEAEFVLRGVSDAYPVAYLPQVGMHFVVFGNVTKPERQQSAYRTRTYTRFLHGVNTWEFTAANVVMQWGDLSTLSLLGLNMQGYSAYMQNIYVSGHIEDVEVSGAHIELQLQSGGWVDARSSEIVSFVCRDSVGRDITGRFTTWRLTRESGDDAADAAWNTLHTSVTSPITLTRSDMGEYWHVRRTLFTLQGISQSETVAASFAIGVRDYQELHIEFVPSRTVVYADDVDVTVEARLFYGEEDVTEELLLRHTTSMSWARDSGIQSEDNAWTPTLGAARNILIIQHGHSHSRYDCGSQWTDRLHCVFAFTAVIPSGVNEQSRLTAQLPLGT
ncbi:MAG: hypothetical protein J5486_04200 [Bacteroidaceae bacterium]|nr:hypothetical protein [Bacteroidaceae bacterium]